MVHVYLKRQTSKTHAKRNIINTFLSEFDIPNLTSNNKTYLSIFDIKIHLLIQWNDISKYISQSFDLISSYL